MLHHVVTTTSQILSISIFCENLHIIHLVFLYFFANRNHDLPFNCICIHLTIMVLWIINFFFVYKRILNFLIFTA